MTLPGMVGQMPVNGELVRDFTEYGTGSLFSSAEWDEPGGTSGFTANVEDAPSALSGRRLHLTNVGNSGLARREERFLVVGTPSDVEVLALCTIINMPQGSNNYPALGIEARVVEGVSSANLLLQWGPSGRIALMAYGTSETETAFDWSVAASWWLRLRVIGNNVKARIWQFGVAEPATWLFDRTGSGLSGSGDVRLLTGSFTAAGSEWACQFFSVATGGNTAAGPTG